MNIIAFVAWIYRLPTTLCIRVGCCHLLTGALGNTVYHVLMFVLTLPRLLVEFEYAVKA
jgi:hypothetical protein